jgi:hypothetical protein
LLLAPFYLAIVLFIAYYFKKRNKYLYKKDYYDYFIPALICKLIGGIGVCLIYSFYYTEGGDVSNYFLSAKTMVNILYSGKFELFFEMLNFYNINISQLSYEYFNYGGLYFSTTDMYALFTVALTVPLCILGCSTFVPTTILLSSLSFIGLWKLYELFVFHFPHLKKQFAIAIFFMPSVFFWGSSILKDTYSLSCIGFFTYGIFKFFILKNRKAKYLILLILSSLIILLIKPYILFALLPGTIIWLNFAKVERIKNNLLKTLVIPLAMISIIIILAISYNILGQYLGEYSLDNILNKAVKTQQDLVRGQYGTNSYDIGAYEPTLAGISSKIPAALNMALFRPFIWDARNPVMVLSGLENLFMLLFTIYIVIRVKITTLIKSLFSNPLLIFSFLFAIFFAFSVGLTTSNYGALVRLKIPCMPFYLISLFILFDLNKARFMRK